MIIGERCNLLLCQFGNDRSQRTFITTPKKTTRDIVHQKCELAVPPNRNHYTMLDYSEKRHLWTLYALMTSVTHTKVETSSPNTFLIGLLLRHLVNDWLSFSISWSWNHDYSREKTVYKWEFPWCIDTMITMNHSNNHSMIIKICRRLVDHVLSYRDLYCFVQLAHPRG